MNIQKAAEQVREILDAIALNSKRCQAGDPSCLREAAWNDLARSAIHAEEALRVLLAAVEGQASSQAMACYADALIGAQTSKGRCRGDCKGHPYNCYGHPDEHEPVEVCEHLFQCAAPPEDMGEKAA